MLAKILLHLSGATILIINFLHKRYLFCIFILVAYFLLNFTISRWASWTKTRKFSMIALWIGALAAFYTLGSFLENRSYNAVTTHNQQVIHKLMEKNFKNSHSETLLGKLKYFHRTSFIASDDVMLSTKEKIHNEFLDYIKLRYFMEQLPRCFALDCKMLGKPRNLLGSSFYKFRKYILNKSIDINGNKYDEFSIFGVKLFYSKLIFHYQEGEYEKIRSLTASGGLRAMMDPTVKFFRLLATKDSGDLTNTLKAYRHHDGDIAQIALHFDKKKLIEKKKPLDS